MFAHSLKANRCIALSLVSAILLLIIGLPVTAQDQVITSVVAGPSDCSTYSGVLVVEINLPSPSGGTYSLTADRISPPGGMTHSQVNWDGASTTPGINVRELPYAAPPGTAPDVPLTYGISLFYASPSPTGPVAFLDYEVFEITCPRQPPVAQDDSVTTPEDTPVDIPVTANDTDANGDLVPATAHAITGPTNGTLTNLENGSFRYIPNLNFNGSDSFRYEVCDATDLCASASVAITVQAVNDPPECAAATPSVGEIWPPNHAMVDIHILGVTDVENDPIAITITGITYTSEAGGNHDSAFAGVGTDTGSVRAVGGREYHISFEAQDGSGGMCSGTVTVLVLQNQGNGNTQPGDFGCDHPGNYCNAPGHTQDDNSESANTTGQESDQANRPDHKDHPGNADNAPGHNKEESSKNAATANPPDNPGKRPDKDNSDPHENQSHASKKGKGQ